MWKIRSSPRKSTAPKPSMRFLVRRLFPANSFSMKGFKWATIQDVLTQLSKQCTVELTRLTPAEIEFHTRRKPVKKKICPAKETTTPQRVHSSNNVSPKAAGVNDTSNANIDGKSNDFPEGLGSLLQTHTGIEDLSALLNSPAIKGLAPTKKRKKSDCVPGQQPAPKRMRKKSNASSPDKSQIGENAMTPTSSPDKPKRKPTVINTTTTKMIENYIFSSKAINAEDELTNLLKRYLNNTPSVYDTAPTQPENNQSSVLGNQVKNGPEVVKPTDGSNGPATPRPQSGLNSTSEFELNRIAASSDLADSNKFTRKGMEINFARLYADHFNQSVTAKVIQLTSMYCNAFIVMAKFDQLINDIKKSKLSKSDQDSAVVLHKRECQQTLHREHGMNFTTLFSIIINSFGINFRWELVVILYCKILDFFYQWKMKSEVKHLYEGRTLMSFLLTVSGFKNNIVYQVLNLDYNVFTCLVDVTCKALDIRIMFNDNNKVIPKQEVGSTPPSNTSPGVIYKTALPNAPNQGYVQNNVQSSVIMSPNSGDPKKNCGCGYCVSGCNQCIKTNQQPAERNIKNVPVNFDQPLPVPRPNEVNHALQSSYQILNSLLFKTQVQSQIGTDSNGVKPIPVQSMAHVAQGQYHLQNQSVPNANPANPHYMYINPAALQNPIKQSISPNSAKANPHFAYPAGLPNSHGKSTSLPNPYAVQANRMDPTGYTAAVPKQSPGQHESELHQGYAARKNYYQNHNVNSQAHHQRFQQYRLINNNEPPNYKLKDLLASSQVSAQNHAAMVQHHQNSSAAQYYAKQVPNPMNPNAPVGGGGGMLGQGNPPSQLANFNRGSSLPLPHLQNQEQQSLQTNYHNQTSYHQKTANVNNQFQDPGGRKIYYASKIPGVNPSSQIPPNSQQHYPNQQHYQPANTVLRMNSTSQLPPPSRTPTDYDPSVNFKIKLPPLNKANTALQETNKNNVTIKEERLEPDNTGTNSVPPPPPPRPLNGAVLPPVQLNRTYASENPVQHRSVTEIRNPPSYNEYLQAQMSTNASSVPNQQSVSNQLCSDNLRLKSSPTTNSAPNPQTVTPHSEYQQSKTAPNTNSVQSPQTVEKPVTIKSEPQELNESHHTEPVPVLTYTSATASTAANATRLPAVELNKSHHTTPELVLTYTTATGSTAANATSSPGTTAGGATPAASKFDIGSVVQSEEQVRSKTDAALLLPTSSSNSLPATAEKQPNQVDQFYVKQEITQDQAQPEDQIFPSIEATNQPLVGARCNKSPCSNPATVLCSGCQRAVYCSAECQEVDWYNQHMRNCDMSNLTTEQIEGLKM